MATTARHGTTARYRSGCRCDRCKSANTRAKRLQRARRKQAGATPILSIVPVPQIGGTSGSTSDPDGAAPAGHTHIRAYGATEKAVHDDLAAADNTGPFFNTLRSAALVLAREIDDIDGKQSKGPLVKQLVETIRELKGKDASDGNSFADLLAELNTPLVPGATLPDAAESG